MYVIFALQPPGASGNLQPRSSSSSLLSRAMTVSWKLTGSAKREDRPQVMATFGVFQREKGKFDILWRRTTWWNDGMMEWWNGGSNLETTPFPSGEWDMGVMGVHRSWQLPIGFFATQSLSVIRSWAGTPSSDLGKAKRKRKRKQQQQQQQQHQHIYIYI